jgi:hypothetical protein
VAAIGVVVVPGIGPAVLGSPGLGLIGGDTFGQPVAVRATLDTEVRLPGAPRIVDSANGSVDSLTGGRPVEVTGPFDAQVTLLSPTAGQRALSIASSVAGPPRRAGRDRAAPADRAHDRRRRPVRAGQRTTAAVDRVRRRRRGPAAQGLGDQARNELLVSSAAGGIVRYAFEFSFPPIVAGLGILTLAEVLRRGALMRADLEGLV